MSSTYPEYPSGYTVPTFLDFVLQSVVDEYDDRSVSLPETKYWMVGTPAYDCSQLTVYATDLSLGLPGAESEVTTCDAGWTLAFNIVVTRCTPAVTRHGSVPEDIAIQESATFVAVDMEILTEVTKRLDPARAGLTAAITAIGPEGGLIGRWVPTR